MDERDLEIQGLRDEVKKQRNRAIEVADLACQMCRASDPDMCRYCRIDKVRKEAAQSATSSMQGLRQTD